MDNETQEVHAGLGDVVRIFTGCFYTTDGMKWGVGFSAHSWEDAESLAELMGLVELGECLGTMPAIHDDPPDMESLEVGRLEQPVPYFCGWHFRNGAFVNEEFNA